MGIALLSTIIVVMTDAYHTFQKSDLKTKVESDMHDTPSAAMLETTISKMSKRGRDKKKEKCMP